MLSITWHHVIEWVLFYSHHYNSVGVVISIILISLLLSLHNGGEEIEVKILRL